MNHDRAVPIPQGLHLEGVNAQHNVARVRTAVVELYERLRPSLLQYACYALGSSQDAEDLVQTAFLRLFDHLVRRAEIRNVRSWLYRVVHNLASDHAGQTRRVSEISESVVPREDAEVESAEHTMIRRQEIEQALSVLNERERHCLMLRADGLSYQEIADVVGISGKAVSVYLVRGLKKFENPT